MTGFTDCVILKADDTRWNEYGRFDKEDPEHAAYEDGSQNC